MKQQPRPSNGHKSGVPPAGMYVQRLRVAYGDRVILKGVDLVFQPGVVTALMGPSGCGKSTLLRCLNRLNDLIKDCTVEGDVFLDRDNVLDLDPLELRREVGMVFQRPNPFPMSIKENVLYGVKATGLKVNHDHTVRASLTKAAIWEEFKGRLDNSALALSLGQQQRLCIARALAVSPRVILMDEPAASLDPASTAKVEETINRMRGEYTVVIVTHNMGQAYKVADYTALLHEGELAEYGPTEQVFNNPQHEITKKYVAGRFN